MSGVSLNRASQSKFVAWKSLLAVDLWTCQRTGEVRLGPLLWWQWRCLLGLEGVFLFSSLLSFWGYINYPDLCFCLYQSFVLRKAVIFFQFCSSKLVSSCGKVFLSFRLAQMRDGINICDMLNIFAVTWLHPSPAQALFHNLFLLWERCIQCLIFTL